MTQEEKFKEAKRLYETANADQRYVLESLFTELKESEDERMIKFIKQQLFNIKKTITENYELDAKLTKAIDWLEKQGEHSNFLSKIQVGDKVTRNEDGVLVNLSQLNRVAKKQGEQKPVAKYKVGDTVYYDSFGRLVSFVIANIVEDGTDNPMYEDKDGNSVFQNDIVEPKPADKVEPKFKVKYAGSEYNVLDIKDIAGVTYYEIEDEPNHIDYVLPNHCKIVSEHKSFWSEEDERLRRKLIELIYAASYCDERENLSDWLKSLKDRYTRKPSDEHYELEEFAKIVRCNLTGISKAVQKLFEAKYLQLTGNKMYGGFKD